MLTAGEQQEQTRDRAHRFRLELMAQFQTQIPYPLADQLPCLLTGGSMTDPAVWVLLLVADRRAWFQRRHDADTTRRRGPR